MAMTGSKSPHYVNEKVLPRFDPESGNLSAGGWIDRVEVIGKKYKWEETTQPYLATLKLKGNAKVWHDGLSQSLLTWKSFADGIQKQFSGDESFGESMDKAFRMDEVQMKIKIFIVPEYQLAKPILIGRNISQPGVKLAGDAEKSSFFGILPKNRSSPVLKASNVQKNHLDLYLRAM
ncbi:hypothetical protein QAD02_023087 [Eretmocerus hayati]|uniref:Uncharacterized protein n=1 Tax=Eretmocerus hayati TaxID=131215 RepID=A0ACC2PUX8_9HYME|nr:hypothetical protein QAD02_023087 [Eretmocerus hayati]